jgi:hypothetical membrane protein
VTEKQRDLALIAVVGVSYFGLTILLLTLFTTDFNPITQAASDYGVGPFAIEMNLGFFVGGIGMIAFASANSLQRNAPKSRAASVLLLIAGLVLIMDSYFTTNVEGGPSTLHGTIHGFGGLFFFITAPIGILLVSRKISRRRFLMTLVSLVVGFAILAAPLNAGGLAERVILLVIFSSVIASSLRLGNRSYR